MDDPLTHPTDNTIAFYTGEDAYLKTRTYGRWLDEEQIKVKTQDYTSLRSVDELLYSPWREPVNLDGTDGMQFHPILTKDDTIAAFVNDLSRTCYFTYDDDSSQYDGIETWVYRI